MVVIVFTVGVAVKPAANSLPEDTKEPEPTQPTMEAVQQEPYPFNLMSLDWSGEELEGWTRYEVPEDYADNGGYLPECMQQYTYIICKPLKYFSSYPLPSSFGKWQKPGPSSSSFSLSISRLFPVSTPSVKRYAPSRLLFDGFWIYAAALSFEPLIANTLRLNRALQNLYT